MTTPKDFPSLTEHLAACLDHVESIDLLLGDLEPMSPSETRHAPHPPRRSTAIIPEIAQVCGELAIRSVGRASLDQMHSDLADAARATLMLERLRLVLARLGAHRSRAETSGWRAALALYDVLKRVAAAG